MAAARRGFDTTEDLSTTPGYTTSVARRRMPPPAAPRPAPTQAPPIVAPRNDYQPDQPHTPPPPQQDYFPDGFPGPHPPYEDGGVTGGGLHPDATTNYRIQPVNQGKFDDPNFHDAKYDFLRIAKKYDPTKGVSQEMIDELNKLGYADWSGSGQHLGYTNGRGGNIGSGSFSGDFIQNWGNGTNPDAQWAWDWKDEGGNGGGNVGGQQAFPGQMFNNAGGGSSSGSGSSSSGTPGFGDLKAQLAKLFPDGLYNQEAVTRRTSNAADTLARQRKSSNATNQAQLAARGLIGDGAEATAGQSLEDRLYQNYSGQVNDIYANESDNADQRMMQALQISAGLTASEAQTAVEAMRAGNDFTLGQGQLGLGRLNSDRNFALGQGNLAQQGVDSANSFNMQNGYFGLARDQQMWNQQHGGIDQLIALIQQYMHGADTSAGGYF